MMFEPYIVGRIDDLLAIYKPPNIHTESGNSENTLFNWCQKVGLISLKKGELLNRLDYETSGIVLLSLKKEITNLCKELFSLHQIKKDYFLVVESLDSSLNAPITVSSYVGSRYRGSKKVSLSKTPFNRSVFCETEFSRLTSSKCENFFLVKASTFYGRRHQIRVQAASIGLPLLGDTLYGAMNSIESTMLPKFILHAHRIYSDIDKLKFSFRAPLYESLKDYLSRDFKFEDSSE